MFRILVAGKFLKSPLRIWCKSHMQGSGLLDLSRAFNESIEFDGGIITQKDNKTISLTKKKKKTELTE